MIILPGICSSSLFCLCSLTNMENVVLASGSLFQTRKEKVRASCVQIEGQTIVNEFDVDER